MSRGVVTGDEVAVMMDMKRFPWQRGPSFDAIVEHVPQDTGDCFQFRVHDPDAIDNVRHIVINPNASAFVGMEVFPDGEPF